LQKANLVVIAARPSMGKSALTLNMATNIAKTGKVVALFSLEMAKEEVVQRILCSVGKVESTKLRTGQIGNQWDRLVSAANQMFRTPIFVDDSSVVTVTDIRAKSRRLKRVHGLDLVVVDYLQLMQGSRRENRQQEIAEISRGLKNLAHELDIPIIAVSQLNRSVEQREDRRPRLSDLRECLTAETEIVRSDNGQTITIGEIARQGLRDVPVWSLDPSMRLVPSMMSEAWSTGVKPVFKVATASGRSIRATANHPLLTRDGWRQVGELSAGDRIGVPRRIPEPVNPAPLKEDEIVLLGHLIGDGSYLSRQPLRYTRADPANHTALRVDLRPRLASVNQHEYGRGWHVVISGEIDRQLGVVPSSIRRQVCPSRPRLLATANILRDEELARLASSDVLWDRIVSIEPDGEEEVFDASVPDGHNFIGALVVCHNSGALEQDADVVVFIYRHEYYHPDDIEKKGTAEIIIAKHRAGATGTVEMTFMPDFTRFADLGRDLA
ncbi:MAG: DnaB-like helicase C-terminal domain-containing protein, partial [Acidimicrobiia bacterium]|nr:DnaB-like helicase C-terminal domain-containing protein [Acidimicrobiia bacterium]